MKSSCFTDAQGEKWPRGMKRERLKLHGRSRIFNPPRTTWITFLPNLRRTNAMVEVLSDRLRDEPRRINARAVRSGPRLSAPLRSRFCGGPGANAATSARSTRPRSTSNPRPSGSRQTRSTSCRRLVPSHPFPLLVPNVKHGGVDSLPRPKMPGAAVPRPANSTGMLWRLKI